jgi:hypothetical protein
MGSSLPQGSHQTRVSALRRLLINSTRSVSMMISVLFLPMKMPLSISSPDA